MMPSLYYPRRVWEKTLMVMFRPHIVRLLVAATNIVVVVAMLSVGWAAAAPHAATFSHAVCVGAGLAAVATVDSSYRERRSDANDGVPTISVDASSQSENGSSDFSVNDCCDATACTHITTIDLLPTERAVSVVLSADTGNLDDRAMPVEPRPPRLLV